VVPADGAAPPDLDDLRTFLEPKLAGFKLPEAIRVVEEIPLTPMQKVDRRGLAAVESRSRP
jgi:non-ribosomal peptide synthetase component E (peptide arylation enzyme)